MKEAIACDLRPVGIMKVKAYIYFPTQVEPYIYTTYVPASCLIRGSRGGGQQIHTGEAGETGSHRFIQVHTAETGETGDTGKLPVSLSRR